MSGIEELRERVDVVEVVGDHVQLKRSGRSYKGLCPFHDEKTPSFVVFPESGNWRCFGACAVGGDAFDFVMRVEGLDFRGAMELLARRYGVELEAPSPQAAEKKGRRERLREATAAAAEFFHQRLMRGADAEPARQYLRDRGFGIDVAQAFGLGWAPDEWTALFEHLKGKGFEEAELLAAGLVKQRDAGGVYDAFRGRVVFPIHDARGRPVGFGARTLDPEGLPKYLNSPRSEIFDKSQVLFGLHRAARAIRTEEAAVVVEGYTDVVRAHVAGFENVVASLGTAITEQQLRLLKRYTRTMVLALDADAAGQAATLRGLEVAREAAAGGVMPVPTGRGIGYARRVDVELKVVSMPAGKDPDDVIREGPANWRKLVAAARPVMEFLFDALTEDLDLKSPMGKTAAAERLMPVLADVEDPVARGAWVARLAEMTQVDEQKLGESLDALRRELRRRQRSRSKPARNDPEARVHRSGRETAPPARGEVRQDASSDAGGGRTGDGAKAGAATGDAQDLPDWVTAEVPLDARAAEMPDEDEAGEVEGGGGRSRDSRPDGNGATESDSSAGAEDWDSGGERPSLRAGSDRLVAWLLGNLLVDPTRLIELNRRLREDGEPALGPGDFGDHFQRDLVQALGYASGGAAPPDAPAEHRLDALPEPLAGYAAELRDAALAQPPLTDVAMVSELRTCCLRLRVRELTHALPGIRYLQMEADDEAQLVYAAKAVELTRRIATVSKLLNSGDDGKPAGKVDPGLRRG